MDCPLVHSSQSVTSGTDLDGYLLQIEILPAGPTWLSQSVTNRLDVTDRDKLLRSAAIDCYPMPHLMNLS